MTAWRRIGLGLWVVGWLFVAPATAEDEPVGTTEATVDFGAMADEFEDLLSDQPRERKKKKEEPKKEETKPEDAPIATWEVGKEAIPPPPLPAAAPPKLPLMGAGSDALATRPKALDSKLPDPAAAEDFDVKPVDWDLGEPGAGGSAGSTPVSTEVSIILANQTFFPARVQLRAGLQTRLYFTTTQKGPAALIIERLNIQRWIAKEGNAVRVNDTDGAPWEITRQLDRDRMTEIVITPRKGTYAFYDALSGARGELVVE